MSDEHIKKDVSESLNSKIKCEINTNEEYLNAKKENNLLRDVTDIGKVENNNLEKEKLNVEPQRFEIQRSIISSIEKKQQAAELQFIEGLVVYDQDKFEAGVLEQVENALEEQNKYDVSCKDVAESATLFLDAQEETQRERYIRFGEMTPFGSTPNADNHSRKEFSILEKYLRDQQELEKKSRPIVQTKKTPVKRKLPYSNSKRNNKQIKKIDFYGCNKKKSPDRTVKQDFLNQDSASGSEYVPSESDGFSSEDDEGGGRTIKDRRIRKKCSKKKVKNSLNGITKIPEDWRSDDSDWEYSDEDESDPNKKRKSKKVIDDGDVDEYNKRITCWKKTNDKNNTGDHKLEGDYQIPNIIWTKLYGYQKVGVQWLWELDQQRCGGILGDEMGLGKTIQVIAFLAGLHSSQLKDKDTGYRGLGPSLIVCPTTVMHQWVREFHTWFPILRVALLHESGTFNGKDKTKLIRNIHSSGGLLVTSYTGVVQNKDALILRKWHYIILDEGHKIRNPDAQVTLVVKQFKTTHRIILSGSPMQNNLKELWSLFDFIFPGKLGTLPVFLAQFAVPITQGGYANASQVQVTTAFKCATVLKDSIAPYLLRRMKADVQSHISLPDKNEQVLFCRLTEEQRKYYKGYLDTPEVDRILQGHAQIFLGLITLRKICNHPDLFSGGFKLFPGETEDRINNEDRYGHWSRSGKMIVVETLLKIWKKQEHRVLIFTQSRQMLTVLQTFVEQQYYKYLKLDGSTSIGARQPLIDKFNQDKSYFIMLLTTRVGGLGVNLTGANRVLIYDPDWNPATDTQARERAWRIGQTQSVTIYRLITAGTIEEKMYHRQIFKQFLTNKVLKDPKQRRFFKSNDLFELFTLKESDVDGSTETGAIFAGTGSEVKLDPRKSYHFHKTSNPKAISEAPTVTFSKKKLEDMKKLAHLLSKKFMKSSVKDINVPEEKAIDRLNGDSASVCSKKNNRDKNVKRNDEQLNEPKSSCKVSRKIHKNKKRKRCAVFEGEPISHLVRHDSAARNLEEDNNIEKTYATQDEYVLKKLFSKSGLQTALKHDTIMEGGPADYALVEGEAERVAKQAVEALKESRRDCWNATSGVPTFTGQSGILRFGSRPRFGARKLGSGAVSSCEIIDSIKQRNLSRNAKETETILLNDIREFVSSEGGTTTTSQIVNTFEKRLPENSSPLFKYLLMQICTFYRAPDKLGYWTLKDDFNW
uniref:DNA excision repair protein ERCC-6 n=2 Tax=Clastoptera arizonana TaxID=38151 RepID=A0A1B6DRP9_9HEMI